MEWHADPDSPSTIGTAQCDPLRELLDRLDTDRRQIADAFHIPPDQTISQLDGPLGDRHNHGRSVYRIRFQNGQSIIYKPRSVHPEDTFCRTLQWLAHAGCEPVLPCFRVLPRGDYGWAEDVAETLYETPHDARHFYRAQGALLAIFWLLVGNDANAENVLVSRAGPVWVDTECMCQPELTCAIPIRASMPEWIRESVLTTDMIYRGLSTLMPRRHTGLGVCCVSDPSLVFDADQVMSVQFVDAVVDGFQHVYHWFLDHRAAWVSPDGPLAWWRECRVRVIIRPTQWYCERGRELQRAAAEGQGVRERIARALRSGEGTGNTAMHWPEALVNAELTILERGDVPYWTASSTSHDLVEASGFTLHDMVNCTGAERAAQRAARASRQDLERQSGLIQTFLRLR